MCGLFGYVSGAAQDLGRSREALRSLEHRGPDQWGEWRDERVYLGHRRLSILDLSERGRQPMADERSGVVIAVNGEIYNFKALRAELVGEHPFRSDSDSEVVLHGYRQWGIDGLLERLEGMYALCVYDRSTGRLYLARDRVGIKPLYHAHRAGTVAWASELKALERFLVDPPLEPDLTAVHDFLTYRYIPSPKSLYKSVFKLRPATCLEIDTRTLRSRTWRYWRLRAEAGDVAIEAATGRLRELIGESVREQMVSDVPVGCFLSGGVDSSVVVSEAARCVPSVDTYAIGFDVREHDETGYARVVADACGTRHHRKVLARDRVAGQLGTLRDWFDEPFADLSAFPTYLVSEYARRGSKVVLTGDGGDEVFGGYRWYEGFRANRAWKLSRLSALEPLVGAAKALLPAGRMRNAARSAENLMRRDPLAVYVRLMGGMTRDEKRSYRREWAIDRDYDDYWYFREFYREDLPVVTRLQFLDFHTYLPDDILTKVDRVSMAVSLEARVPLLSTRLVEYLFGLPEPVRLADGRLKGLLRRAYVGVLPREILERGKKGFGVPLKRWGGAVVDRRRTAQEEVLIHCRPDLVPWAAGRGVDPARAVGS